MTRRLVSLFAAGAIALTAVPVFAEDASSSAASESSTSLSSSVGSASSSSTASSDVRRMKQNNLGQTIKQNCSKLSGKSRAECVHSTIKDRKMTGKSVMKKPVMRPAMMKKTCSEFPKHTPEFQECVKAEKEKSMMKNPSGVMKKIQNMRMKYRNNGGIAQ